MGDYQDCLKNGKITLGMNFNKKMETNLLYGLPPRQAMACGGCSLESVGLKALIWWPRVSQKNETCWINKFYGVFKLNVEESKKRGLCYFERIATEVSLQKQGD